MDGNPDHGLSLNKILLLILCFRIGIPSHCLHFICNFLGICNHLVILLINIQCHLTNFYVHPWSWNLSINQIDFNKVRI
jgi:hypothetical protein